MTGTCQLGDVSLHVFDEGSGSPLLFVHGFPLDHTMWQAQLDRFARSHRVIAPDLRGFGNSSVTSGTVTMERFADDLADLLDRLRISQPVTLCGLSMGGYVAWQFWKRHRNRLEKLILCDTRAGADAPQARTARLDLAARVLQEGPGFLAESMPEKLYAPATLAARPPFLAATQQVIRNTPPAGIAAASRGMAERLDVTAWLPEIDLPTLIIVGAKDQISPPQEMQRIAETLPRARFVIIPNAGHMAPQEEPDAVNRAIEDFLAASPPDSGR